MMQDLRLNNLIEAIAKIAGHPVANELTAIGDLGIDSKYLIDIMLVCEDIYGECIDFAEIDFGYETTLLSMHKQLSDHIATVRDKN